MDTVVLVNSDDEPVGTSEKLAAHRAPGQLHRALSVFLVDPAGRVLLQQRARTKHHFGGLWSNTCCTHPRPDEQVPDAAHRRLGQEMGVDADLVWLGTFTYRAEDPASGLVEHELDHVFLGSFEGTPDPDPSEVMAWRWVEERALRTDLASSPALFTPWLAPALALVPSPGNPDNAVP